MVSMLCNAQTSRFQIEVAGIWFPHVAVPRQTPDGDGAQRDPCPVPVRCPRQLRIKDLGADCFGTLLFYYKEQLVVFTACW